MEKGTERCADFIILAHFMQFSDTWKFFSISSMYIAPSIMIVNENPIMDPLEIQETFDLTPTSFHL